MGQRFAGPTVVSAYLQPLTNTMNELPETPYVSDLPALDATLSLLLEPSPILHSRLAPSLYARLALAPPPTYNALIDLCAANIGKWSDMEKEAFLRGHPLIGEVKGLSKMSGKEQGGAVRTPEVVLKR